MRLISFSKLLLKQNYRKFSSFPKKNLVLLKFPFAGGQPKSGVELAPDQLDAFILHKFAFAEKKTVNLPPEIRKPNNPKSEILDNCKNAPATFAAIGELFKEMRSIFAESENNRIMVIGGDHSMAIGSIAAAAEFHKNLQIIWLDAHADLNIPEESPSKNIHGMSAAFLLGLAKKPEIPWFPKIAPLTPDRLFYIGLRDLDPWENWAMENLKIGRVSVADFNRSENFMELLINLGLNLNDPVHISFDVDSLNDSEIPCTGVPVPNGLNLEKILQFFHQIFSGCKNIVSIEITELNFALAKNKQELETSKRTMKKIFNSFMEKNF